jgi:peptidyl-prolyl cis-trans isomerase SurA
MLKSPARHPAPTPNAIFTAIMFTGMKKGFVFLLGLLAFASVQHASAQTKRVVADKIIGKVGDRIILQSDIINAINDIQRQGGEVPPNPDCIIMESELVKKALVLQAEKDSITVDDAELESMIENQIRGFIQAYGGREALEEIAGRTIYQIKEDFRKPLKEKELANKMRNKILENVRITPNEIQDYFDAIPKDSLPYYESELEVGQIVNYPKASRDIESYTAKQLNDIKNRLKVVVSVLIKWQNYTAKTRAAKKTVGNIPSTGPTNFGIRFFCPPHLN